MNKVRFYFYLFIHLFTHPGPLNCNIVFQLRLRFAAWKNFKILHSLNFSKGQSKSLKLLDFFFLLQV